jgi:hypothetical protein
LVRRGHSLRLTKERHYFSLVRRGHSLRLSEERHCFSLSFIRRGQG